MSSSKPSVTPSISQAEMARITEGRAGVRLVVLFGSVARGQARDDSDLDVGILGGEFWDALSIGASLGAHFGREPQVVDLATANDLLRFEVS